VVPGNYFQGEAELESGESWQGLFQMDTFFELRTVELHVEDAQSLVDRGKEKTGKDVFVSEEKGNLLFLIKSDELHFADGPVEPILFYTDKIAADTSIVIEGSLMIFTDQEGLFLTDGEVSQRLSDVYPNAYGEGVSVVWAGDLDGDGVVDIAVGAGRDHDGGTWHGAVWILFLNTDGTVKSYQKISDTEGNFSGNLENGDIFGSSLSLIGDLDSDGTIEIVVGARGDDDGGTDKGAVWIISIGDTCAPSNSIPTSCISVTDHQTFKTQISSIAS
jgi:hypothetical protein